MKQHPLLDAVAQNLPFLTVGGLWGSSKAYAAALIRRETAAPCLLITPTQKRAEELFEDLTFFQKIGLLPVAPDNIHLYSQWNIAPYEHAAPLRDIVAERLTVLDKLSNHENIVVVAPVEAALHRTIPRAALREFSILVGVGEELNREQLAAMLVDTGYKHAHLVENRGEFSIRGGILDLFPAFGDHPIRIEFFGDTVESLREFDPATQRSSAPLDLISILPGRELVVSDSTCAAAKANLDRRVAEVGASLNALRSLTTHLDEKIFFPGIEWYAAYFHGELESLLDYLAPNALIFLDEPAEIRETCQKFTATAQKQYRLTEEKGYPLPAPESVFLTPDAFQARLAARRKIALQLLNIGQTPLQPSPNLGEGGKAILLNLGEKNEASPSHNLGEGGGGVFDFPTKTLEWAGTFVPDEQEPANKDHHIAAIARRVGEWLEDRHSVIIAAYAEHQAKRLWEILRDNRVAARILPEMETGQNASPPVFGQTPEAVIVVGTLNCGFLLPQERLIFLNEDEFLGKQTVRRRHIQPKQIKAQMTLGELDINDYVVHVDHGIGVYLGLKKLTVQAVTMECLHLEYSGGDKLYVPVDRLDLVQKYLGADQHRPKIDKLGGTSWARVKERVKASVEKMARELLDTYAARQALPGMVFTPDERLYREFEASFEYEETPDQNKAIEDVARDMSSSKPMDRLVCGDVGYGKTEVAMRAAFRAVLNGKQVAVLVPTTILAQQHSQTFAKRFAEFPVNIGVLNRFQTKKEQQEIVAGLKTGAVDIVIGTHRLLQKDIGFKDLGLVIIDEEQRFGVTHKEKIRQYRTLVDVLTLTATPIPRTLHMSLMGVRDLSIIESPPEGRLAVRTYVMKFDDDVIYEAITRELDRGGQVFFVHNDIETIDGIALRVTRMLPHVRVAIAHGQMRGDDLEEIMLKFINRDLDVLISTTIVESGIDIPSVNTMIINRADKFGLSQLYQLRGRIGRSKERAYAYLLVPAEELLTSDAKKRLRVIQELSELGSGFKLAAHDLEIRGAGSLLGAEQTGHIAALGFDMYCNIIEKTVRELRGQPLREEFYPQIDMRVSAFFPEEYIPDTHQRLDVYKRLMSAGDFAAILDVEDEIRDRYGKLPDAAEALVALAELKLMATTLRVQQIQAFDGSVKLVFDAETSATDEQLKRAAKRSERAIRYAPPLTLIVEMKRLKNAEKITAVKEVLKALNAGR